MGHRIRIILGKETDIQTLADQLGPARVVSSEQGFAFIPLTTELYDRITEKEGGFSENIIRYLTFLSSLHFELLKRQSRQTQLAYLETDYFGGTGSQSAILFQTACLSLGHSLFRKRKYKVGFPSRRDLSTTFLYP